MTTLQWVVLGIALGLLAFYLYVLLRIMAWCIDVAFMFMGWSNGNRNKKKK
jgi:hypothetical protein